MQNYFYKAIISYNGTNYSGWQSQKNKNGVQDKVENSLFNLFKQFQKIKGASRTDAGVHAYSQVIKFSTPILYDKLDYLKKIINNCMPEDIYFISIEKCESNFCPRLNAKKKMYSYFLSFKHQNIILSPFISYYSKEFNINLFQNHLNNFIGTHDFISFSTTDKKNINIKNRIRTIDSCKVKILQNEIIQITIIGNGFLRYMIRKIIGAAIISSIKNYSINYLKTILLEKKHQNNLFTAPAKGLMLMDISYDENYEFSNLTLFDIF